MKMAARRRVQSREASLLEAATNVALGFVLALLLQALIYPLLGIHTTMLTDSTIAMAFLLMSLVRSYLVRRAFELFVADSNTSAERFSWPP
jgi:ABC-type branched-subunit amino acid transport system permease subunit